MGLVLGFRVGGVYSFGLYSLMTTTSSILLSLEPQHAENILRGTKTIELRTRKMHLEPGTRVWLYAKKPVGAVVGFAILDGMVELPPADLWESFGQFTGITADEFSKYFSNRSTSFGIKLQTPKRLTRKVTLSDIRKGSPHFAPPQFYKRFTTSDATLEQMLVES
jgi:predicted transcriptional regulator